MRRSACTSIGLVWPKNFYHLHALASDLSFVRLDKTPLSRNSVVFSPEKALKRYPRDPGGPGAMGPRGRSYEQCQSELRSGQRAERMGIAGRAALVRAAHQSPPRKIGRAAI